VWTVERIRRNLVSRFGHHTLWAGVACYPAHAFDSGELMAQVRLALETAKEWKQDRIEVAAAD
jgi:GGDEF domain-containing protein